MNQKEKDWGGTIEFGFEDKKFSREVKEYFYHLRTIAQFSHSCAGRVMGVLEHVRDNVVKPPTHDPRNILDLVE